MQAMLRSSRRIGQLNSPWGLKTTILLRSLTADATSSSSNTNDPMDVLIVGGGATGCALAKQINETIPHLKVGLLEARGSPTHSESPIPHPRSYALSPRSLNLLGQTVQSKLKLGFYDSMQVWQANSPASLTFSSKDLDPDPMKEAYLGACVEDGPLVATLWDEIQGKTNCWTNTSVESLNQLGDSNSLASVTLSNGETIETKVLVGCDGGNSWIRQKSGIPRTGIEYQLNALTFTVELDGSLNKRAFQRYLDDGGPMALLPTHSDKHAVIVWSTNNDTVANWKDADDDKLVQHLNDCLLEGPQRIKPLVEREDHTGPSIVSNILYGAERVLDTLHYGLAMASHHPQPQYAAPPRIKAIAGPKFSFPLSSFHANSYVKGRMALVGDAAHTVHPMAGQGLNLGFNDVEVLVQNLKKASNAGMDLTTFFHEYDSDRQRNISLSLGGIHALQRIFSNQDAPALHAKTLGMNVIQNVGPLRRQLAAAAAYGVAP